MPKTLLAALPLWFSMVAGAQSPYAGVWSIQPQLTTFSLRPAGFTLEHGIFHNDSCVPDNRISTDGAEHAVTGDPWADAISVRVSSRSRVEVTKKMSGKITWRGQYDVSADHNSMTLKYEDWRATKPVAGKLLFTRQGAAMPGAHPMSGTWQGEKLLQLSDAALQITIEDTANGLKMSAGDGRKFDIQFDRRDYPLVGYLPDVTVQVGRRPPRTLQINEKRNGILVEFSLGAVAEDGNSMLLSQIDNLCQSKTTWTLVKQPAP